MTATDPIIQAWQTSVTEAPLPALADLRAGVDRFHRIIQLRNRVEYGASVLVVICFGLYTFVLPSPIARIGAFMIVLATLLVVWQLHRRASAIAAPTEDGARPLIAHQRAQLVRQRDALARVWLWYLLPFAPGLAVMMFGPTIARDPAALLHMGWGESLSILFVVAVFVGIWWLNRRAARKLQKAIGDLDALRADEERRPA
jgi:cobalamin synthase